MPAKPSYKRGPNSIIIVMLFPDTATFIKNYQNRHPMVGLFLVQLTEAKVKRPPFADVIFKWIVFIETCCIFIQILLTFVPKHPIDKKPSVIQKAILFSVATMRNYLALALLAALVCYVTAAPRRPFRGPAMGRVPNPLDPMPSTHHERPHHGPNHGTHHRRPKVVYVARATLQFYPDSKVSWNHNKNSTSAFKNDH